MSKETQLVTASSQLAQWVGMDAQQLIKTIKAQCFKGIRNQDEITDTQLAVYVQLANTLKLNPMLPGMLYAYPDKGGGIVPMIGPDGIFKLLMEHPEIISWDSQTEKDEDGELVATAKIWLKDADQPIVKRCYLSEWKIQSNPNWNTRPRHMLEIRALKLAARQVVHGIPYDEDERIMMGDIESLKNVTPEQETTKERPSPPKQAKGVAGARAAATAAQEKQDSKDSGEVVEGEVVDDEPTPDLKSNVAENVTAPSETDMQAEEVIDMESPSEDPEPVALESLESGQIIEGTVTVASTFDCKINQKPAKKVVTTAEGIYKGDFFTFNVDRDWKGKQSVKLEGKSAKTKNGTIVMVFEV